MKLKLLGTLALSSIILTACGQENVKKQKAIQEEQNKTDNMQTNGSVTNSNSNQKQKQLKNKFPLKKQNKLSRTITLIKGLISNKFLNLKQI